MGTHNMFLWRNKKNINTFWLKKMPYLVCCSKPLRTGKLWLDLIPVIRSIIISGGKKEMKPLRFTFCFVRLFFSSNYGNNSLILCVFSAPANSSVAF